MPPASTASLKQRLDQRTGSLALTDGLALAANSNMQNESPVYTEPELAALLGDVESDLVERKATFDGDAPNTVRQAICAFANDLPNHRRPGVIFIGVDDAGEPTGLEVDDALLLKLAHCKTDGNILPLPTMTVSKHTFGGQDVAIVTVAPADSPPVRCRGRIWTRVGPRRAIASAQDERILNERRRHGDIPFDARPVASATLEALDLRRFELLYLPGAFSDDVLERNDRTMEQRLAATKMVVSADDPTPTTLGMLVFGRVPTEHLPGAYIQFLRIAGEERGDPIVDADRIDGPLDVVMADLDAKLRSHVRTAVDIGVARTELRRPSYPFDALRELVRNAVMHRAYDSGNNPIQVYWFDRHIEVISPGGCYGEVNEDNFGEPGVVAYRNPNLADAMRVLGLVQRYGWGIPLVRRALRENDQPPPEYRLDPQWVRCTVRQRRDEDDLASRSS